MSHTIATLTATMILTGTAVAAHAQSAPSTSATALQGVEARSIQTTPLSTPPSASPAPSARDNTTPSLSSLLGISDNIDIQVGPRDTNSPLNVFPNSPADSDGGFRVMYRFDQK